MICPFPGPLTVYHDEFHLVIRPPYSARGIDILPLVTRTIFIGYPGLDYQFNATGVLTFSGTRKYYAIHHLYSIQCRLRRVRRATANLQLPLYSGYRQARLSRLQSPRP